MEARKASRAPQSTSTDPGLFLIGCTNPRHRQWLDVLGAVLRTSNVVSTASPSQAIMIQSTTFFFLSSLKHLWGIMC